MTLPFRSKLASGVKAESKRALSSVSSPRTQR